MWLCEKEGRGHHRSGMLTRKQEERTAATHGRAGAVVATKTVTRSKCHPYDDADRPRHATGTGRKQRTRHTGRDAATPTAAPANRGVLGRAGTRTRSPAASGRRAGTPDTRSTPRRVAAARARRGRTGARVHGSARTRTVRSRPTHAHTHPPPPKGVPVTSVSLPAAAPPRQRSREVGGAPCCVGVGSHRGGARSMSPPALVSQPPGVKCRCQAAHGDGGPREPRDKRGRKCPPRVGWA